MDKTRHSEHPRNASLRALPDDGVIEIEMEDGVEVPQKAIQAVADRLLDAVGGVQPQRAQRAPRTRRGVT